MAAARTAPEVPEWVTEDDLTFLEEYVRTGAGDRPGRSGCVPWTRGPLDLLPSPLPIRRPGELKDRLARMLGPAANDIWASTFHSACVRILRRDIEKLGFASSFTIYDTDDSLRVVKDILKDLGIDDKQFPPRSVLGLHL